MLQQKQIACRITFTMLPLQVLAAIHLNHQQCRSTIEVNDIGTNRFLSVEVESKELFAPQMRPQQLLSISHLLAKFARWLLQLMVVWSNHGKSPLSPLRKGGYARSRAALNDQHYQSFWKGRFKYTQGRRGFFATYPFLLRSP